MSSNANAILKLIEEGKSCNEMCQLLDITNIQLYRRLLTLRNNGFSFDRRYYSDGSIAYRKLTNLKSVRDFNNYTKIITRPGENRLRALAISDIHFGSKLERLDLLDRVYNYCIKNGIHIIFITGDLIDGNFGQSEKRIKSVEKQITHLKNHYPFDKSILNFAVGGDHDINALYAVGQDLIEVLRNYRQDIVLVNYNNTFVNIKNDKILLHHHINTGKMFDVESNCPVMLIGHNHEYGIFPQYDGNTLSIKVPSLSDINESLPTALELDFSFKHGFTSSIVVSQIYFGDRDYILSRFNYEYNRAISLSSGTCYNLEDYSFESEIKEETGEESLSSSQVVEPPKRILSPTEKFNKKWHLE